MLTWDGVTNENTVGIPEAGVYLHPVSECVPSMEQFIGATMVVDANGQDKAVEVSSNMVSAMGDSVYSVASDTGLFVTTADNVEFNGLIFPKKGIYFQLLDLSDGVFYIKSLTIPNYEFTTTVVQKIDPKYLPEHSWNDLEDKPFGEEFISLGDTLTWDGVATEDTIDMQGAVLFHRLASDVLTAEELETGDFVYILEDAETTLPIKGNYAEAEDGCIRIQVTLPSGFPMVVFMSVPYDGYEVDGLVVDKGVYGCNFVVGNLRGKSLTVPNKDFKKAAVKQIESKYIPNYENTIRVKVDMDMETNTYTVDKTYTELRDHIMFGGRLVLDMSVLEIISGVTAEGRCYCDNYAWSQSTFNGTVTGSIRFYVSPDIVDGNMKLGVFEINSDDTSEYHSASIPLVTE